MCVEAKASKKTARLNEKKITMVAGRKKTITLKNNKKLSKQKIRKVKWSSSNKKVATVKAYGKYRQKGKITAKKAGLSF